MAMSNLSLPHLVTSASMVVDSASYVFQISPIDDDHADVLAMTHSQSRALVHPPIPTPSLSPSISGLLTANLSNQLALCSITTYTYKSRATNP